MKSIFYAGAILMIGASIYGFVDYKKTSRNKEFKNMYAEKKVSEPEPVNINDVAAPVTNIEEKNSSVKKKETKTTVVKNKKSVKKARKTRKFNTELFSRGAMDERYIEPIKEEKKSDN